MNHRRQFLFGLSGVLAIPAIAHAGSLMRVSTLINKMPHLTGPWITETTLSGDGQSCFVVMGNKSFRVSGPKGMQWVKTQLEKQTGLIIKALPLRFYEEVHDPDNKPWLRFTSDGHGRRTVSQYAKYPHCNVYNVFDYHVLDSSRADL